MSLIQMVIKVICTNFNDIKIKLLVHLPVFILYFLLNVLQRILGDVTLQVS